MQVRDKVQVRKCRCESTGEKAQVRKYRCEYVREYRRESTGVKVSGTGEKVQVC